MSAIAYRPEIDGLRALAVSAVVVFHLDPRWLPGGFTGVDVFFVISGFLITSIIRKEFEAGRFSFAGFWVRRARRILPALSVMVIVTLLAGFLVLLPSNWSAAGWHGISVMGFFANISMWRLVGDYWGLSSGVTPLLHTWSLAIEEQYYLLFPLILVPLLRFARRYTLPLVVGGTIGSLTLCFFVTREHPNAAFYLLPTRAWELSTGAVLALLPQAQGGGLASRSGAAAIAFLGLGVVLASFVLLRNENDFPGLKAALPVAGTALLLWKATSDGFPGKALAWAPLVYLGKISYSLYLWHWPVLAYLTVWNQQNGTSIPGFAMLPLIGFLAVSSYHWVESPARTSPRWVLPAVLLVVGGIGVSVAMRTWPVPDHSDQFNPVVWNGRLYDVTPAQKPLTGTSDSRLGGLVVPPRPSGEAGAFRDRGIVRNHGGAGIDVVVFGDSHALMWASTIDRACRDLSLTVSFFAADGTHPELPRVLGGAVSPQFTPSQRLEFDEARRRLLAVEKPRVVVIGARFSNETDTARFLPLLDLVRETGGRGVLVSEPPPLSIGDRGTLGYVSDLYAKGLLPEDGVRVPPGYPESWKFGNALMVAALAKYPGFLWVDITGNYFDATSGVTLLKGRDLLYIDDDHLSEFGAALSENAIRTAIQAATGDRG